MATAESVEQAVYTMKDVATILDVGERTVDRWVRDGKLRSFKVENTRRIPKAAVEELLASGSETVGPHNSYGAGRDGQRCPADGHPANAAAGAVR